MTSGRSRVLLTFALLTLAAASVATAAPPFGAVAYHLEVAHSALGAGEHRLVRVSPPPPADTYVIWDGAEPAADGEAVVQAPYVIAPGSPPLQVRVVVTPRDRSRPGVAATTTIELAPGAVPGADDCLGPGQSWPTFGSYVYVDELPEALTTVAPIFPPGIRDLPQTVTVKALVCRTGRVLDAIPVLQERAPGGGARPIARDPRIVDAAVDAVRQWVFQPARAQGAPVAVWVVVPVRFGS